MDTSKLSFQDWLLNQVAREDHAGRLARRTLQIDTFVKVDNAYASWHKLFSAHGAGDDVDQLRAVWAEYLEARAELKRRSQ